MRFSWIKIFFTPLRGIKNLFGLLTTCLFCQQTLTLLFLMFSIWTLGAAYAFFYLHDPNWGQWSFVHLFDLTEARRTLNESSGVGKAVAVLLYGVTWLIGGGILLGVIVDRSARFMSTVRDGHVRYRRALRDHFVILGWEPNVVSLLRNLSGGGRLLSFFSLRALFRPRIVILSECPAVEIHQQIAEAFGRSFFKVLPFGLIVYNGAYDAKDEFKMLALRYARKIYVTGEEPEASHDSRVLLFLASLDALLGKYKPRQRINCHVRIASYSLFRLLVLSINKGSPVGNHKYEYLTVRFFNFYENWAKRLFSENPANGRAYPSLVFRPDDGQSRVRVVVVGFGKMGQALVVEILRSHPQRKGRMIDIVVVDPDVNVLRKQFMMSHSDIATGEYMKHATLRFAKAMRVEDAAFRNMIKRFEAEGGQITVMLTYNSPDDVVVRAVALASKYKSANIFARLNIAVPDVDKCRDVVAESYKLNRLYLYGFKDGAGFGKEI